jgi:hypothetical protein
MLTMRQPNFPSLAINAMGLLLFSHILSVSQFRGNEDTSGLSLGEGGIMVEVCG